MSYKIYTTDGVFIEETYSHPRVKKFTGMYEYDNTKYWYIDDKRHRLDGPAVESSDGTKGWFIDDKRINCSSNEHFKLLVDIMKLKGLK